MRRANLNPKIETIWSLYFAGPVAANSPHRAHSTHPPVGPFRFARWGSPFATPPAGHLTLALENIFGLGLMLALNDAT